MGPVSSGWDILLSRERVVRGTKVHQSPVAHTDLFSHHFFAQDTMLFWVQYHKGAVDDLNLVYKASGGDRDPTSNPALRKDKAWGPFTDSKFCSW